MQLGEYENALISLRKAQRFEPNDKIINQALIELNHLQAQINEHERTTYRNMFNGKIVCFDHHINSQFFTI